MKAALAIIAALAALALTSWLVLRNEKTLTAHLPMRVSCVNLVDALEKANKYSSFNGGQVCGVLGTGSMAPYIPAAPDKAKVVVAFAVLRPPQAFDSISQGDLLVYRPSWGSGLVVHVASQKSASGWIMSGIGNARSESNWRVDALNYVGTVAAVFVCP